MMKIPYKKCLPLSAQYFHSQFDLTLIIRAAYLVSSSIWQFFYLLKDFSVSYYTILSLRLHHKIIYIHTQKPHVHLNLQTFYKVLHRTLSDWKITQKGCTMVTSPLPWCILRIIIFVILLNDSCGFHIHAHHRYVLPHDYAHDENTSHLDYTQVFH